MLREMLLETQPWVLALTFIGLGCHIRFLSSSVFRNAPPSGATRRPSLVLARTIVWNALSAHCDALPVGQRHVVDGAVLERHGLLKVWKLTKAVTWRMVNTTRGVLPRARRRPTMK